MLIRFDANAIKRLADRMGRMHGDGRLHRAITEGLREGGDKTRTAVRRALVQQTGVKAYRSITSRTRSFAENGGLAYVIVGAGKGMPINEFKTKIARGAGGGVLSAPWAVGRQFQRSFGLKGKGVDGARARTSNKRFPIRKLYGPSVAKEIVKGQSAAAFFHGAETFVLDRIIVRIGRGLG